jgi:hypothetical protein
MTSGRMDFRLQNETKVFPGDMILISSGVEHDGWYHEDCELVEFFLPPRFDLCLAAMNNPFGLSGGGEPAKVLIDRSLGRRARRPKTPEDHLA